MNFYAIQKFRQGVSTSKYKEVTENGFEVASDSRYAIKYATRPENVDTSDYYIDSWYKWQDASGWQFGLSEYDKNVQTLDDAKNLQDFRASQQSIGEKWWRGAKKFLARHISTMVSGSIGFINGIYDYVTNFGNIGFAQAMADNATSKTMDEWMNDIERNNRIYKTKDEEANPIANFFSAANLADNLLANFGFTTGAMMSGKFWGGSANKLATRFADSRVLRALRNAKNAGEASKVIARSANVSNAVSTLVGAGTAAINEGAIEALHTANEVTSRRVEEYQREKNKKLNEIDANRDLSEEERNALKEEVVDEYRRNKDLPKKLSIQKIVLPLRRNSMSMKDILLYFKNLSKCEMPAGRLVSVADRGISTPPPIVLIIK